MNNEITTEDLERMLYESGAGGLSWQVTMSRRNEYHDTAYSLRVHTHASIGVDPKDYWEDGYSPPVDPDGYCQPDERMDCFTHRIAAAELISIAPYLARRVIAAEELVEALRGMAEVAGDIPGDWSDDHQVVTCAGHFRMVRAALSEWEAGNG